MNVIAYRPKENGRANCECGCGQETRLDRDGVPRRFVKGHNGRGERNVNWRGDSAGYVSVHSWIKRRYPKTGSCENCGKQGYTEYAFLRHPLKHTRNREDYRELCKSCHERMDKGPNFNWAANRTHCKRGHEYNEINTRITPQGKRQCRRCVNERYHEQQRVAA